jgi:hypothetical protein
MRLRLLSAGLLLAASLLTTGCFSSSCCNTRPTVASASPCCPTAPSCCSNFGPGRAPVIVAPPTVNP